MARESVYFKALAAFTTPATVREVHNKALQMFGSTVKGDRATARQCLNRYVKAGMAERSPEGYMVSMRYADPLTHLDAEVKCLRAENKRLLAQNDLLETHVKQLQLALKAAQDK